MGVTSIDVRGVRVPWILYGTAWKQEDTERLTRLALEQGFVGIDTANQRKHYFEAGVGAAITPWIAQHGRDALFVQTKFTYARGQDHRLPYDPAARPAEQVRQSFASSLEHLGLTRIDSYVLHGPELSRGLSRQECSSRRDRTGARSADGRSVRGEPMLSANDGEVWSAMESLHDEGGARLLGVSNISAEQLEMLVASSRVTPAFVQNRCYAAQRWDADVRAVCRAHGITYQGFSLLTANRPVWEHPRTAAIARRVGATPAQVIFALARALDIIPLTGTRDARHMQDDLAAHDVALGADELRELQSLG